MSGRSILLVCHYYPPSAGAAVQRPLLMTKHLRRMGHRVTILTTGAFGSLPDDIGDDVHRTYDLQLLQARLRGARSATPILEAETYSNRPHPLSYVLVPEALALAWAPFAVAAAIRLHRREHFDCVITSSPPESGHLAGRALQRMGAAWIADIRDGWAFESYRPPWRTKAQDRLDRALERRLMRAADAVTAVAQPLVDYFRDELGANAALVPNGWDPEDFDDAAPASEAVERLIDPARVSLVHTGRLEVVGRDPAPLVEALQSIAADDPATAARLELVFAGTFTERERALLGADVSPGADRRRRQPAARGRACTPAGGGRPAADHGRHPDARGDRQAVRVPRRRAADPRARRGHRGRARRARRGRRTQRAAGGRLRGSDGARGVRARRGSAPGGRSPARVRLPGRGRADGGAGGAGHGRSSSSRVHSSALSARQTASVSRQRPARRSRLDRRRVVEPARAGCRVEQDLGDPPRGSAARRASAPAAARSRPCRAGRAIASGTRPRAASRRIRFGCPVAVEEARRAARARTRPRGGRGTAAAPRGCAPCCCGRRSAAAAAGWCSKRSRSSSRAQRVAVGDPASRSAPRPLAVPRGVGDQRAGRVRASPPAAGSRARRAAGSRLVAERQHDAARSASGRARTLRAALARAAASARGAPAGAG